MPSNTTTETLQTTETVQAWYTDTTYSLTVWVPSVHVNCI